MPADMDPGSRRWRGSPGMTSQREDAHSATPSAPQRSAPASVILNAQHSRLSSRPSAARAGIHIHASFALVRKSPRASGHGEIRRPARPRVRLFREDGRRLVAPTGAILLAHPVVAPRLLFEPPLIFRCEFRPLDRQRQLVQLAGELERHLAVLVVHRRAGSGAHVKGLVSRWDDGERALTLLLRSDLAVDLQDAGAAATDAADIVEGERGKAQSVIFEIELERVLAGRELGPFPPDALEVYQIGRAHV